MRLFIAVLAATLAFPATASAETWYLVIGARHGDDGGITTLPMTNEEECKVAGQTLWDSRTLGPPNDIHGTFKHVRWLCLKGK